VRIRGTGEVLSLMRVVRGGNSALLPSQPVTQPVPLKSTTCAQQNILLGTFFLIRSRGKHGKHCAEHIVKGGRVPSTLTRVDNEKNTHESVGHPTAPRTTNQTNPRGNDDGMCACGKGEGM
jgi:hypothetical protein